MKIYKKGKLKQRAMRTPKTILTTKTNNPDTDKSPTSATETGAETYRAILWSIKWNTI